MDLYSIMSLILTLAVAMAYVNHRFVKMPTTIAIMFSSLILSLGLIVLREFGFSTIEDNVADILVGIDFHDLLMKGMLSYLLFAGALNVDIGDLKSQKWEISVLATLSTVLSTVIIAFASFYILNYLGVDISLIYCFLFGALISPTDPIAVLAIFKKMKAPKKMSIFLEGESLFNDGVGIVLFITISQIAFSGESFTWQGFSVLFLQQAVGGLVFGAALGFITYYLLKPIDSHKIEILVTLAVVSGGYSLAEVLEVSGPLAMVVAGIFIGNHGRKFSMSANTSQNLDIFWEVIDEVLNAILFLLIGFEILVITSTKLEWWMGVVAIVMVLLTRFICVALPMTVFKRRKDYFPHMTKILVWGGLRGGLAVALALSLPASGYRDIILTMTYAVVVFSILIQGMTMKPVIQMSINAEKS